MTTETSRSLELNCKELVELVTDYIENALSSAERQRFDEHLAACPYCALYLDEIRQTVRALGRLPSESLSGEALDTLLVHFRRWR